MLNNHISYIIYLEIKMCIKELTCRKNGLSCRRMIKIE